jgi:uncharacterized protein YndB with AHSA1/START domain
VNLHLERTLAAPPERVFAACVDARSLAEWFGPHGYTCTLAELDARAGGRYRLTMRPPEGDVFHIGGELREVDPPRRLAFTFLYEEPGPDDRENLVELAFEPAGDGTRLVLDQGPFATGERLELHRGGWTDTLERLDQALAARAG